VIVDSDSSTLSDERSRGQKKLRAQDSAGLVLACFAAGTSLAGIERQRPALVEWQSRSAYLRSTKADALSLPPRRSTPAVSNLHHYQG
jgi:hypothetical protein